MSSNRLFRRLGPEAERIWREIALDVKYPRYRKDPWQAREAWRYAPEFSKTMYRKLLFGGTGYGVAGFALYCIGEYCYSRLSRRQRALNK